jgi:hypothetical protein
MTPRAHGGEHPLAYPAAVTAATVAVLALLALIANGDQLSGLFVLGVGVLGYSAVQLIRAWRGVSALPADARRIRQEFRLTSRSWIEVSKGPTRHWIPVYFDPALVTTTDLTALRLYPSGRRRDREPLGKLIDNPSRPDDDAPKRAANAAHWRRRVLLDAQSTVAAPFIGLFWVYVVGGGFPGFLGASVVGAAAAIWLCAIRGSDPS